MHDRIWFEVGWDYASYGLVLPEDVDHPALSRGFREGRERFRKPIGPHNRFIRKWLRLRLNAVKRRRQFDADVTPEFLASIATAVCPITREPLTYGTLTDTDWSIDRLINDGGYSQNNLAMMSVRANTAKDKMTIEQIVDQCIAGDQCDPILRPVEWSRLYSLCVGVHIYTGHYDSKRNDEVVFGQHIVPLIINYPTHLPVSPFQHIQRTIVFYWQIVSGSSDPPLFAHRKLFEREYAQLKGLFKPEGVKVLQKIGWQIEKDLSFIGPPEKLLWAGKTFSLIQRLTYHLRPDSHKVWLNEALEGERLDRYVQEFGLATKGFIR